MVAGSASEVVMPRLSDSMEEGTILEWLKSVGDEVAVGDALVEIETDKANMVYEADAAGTLVEILAGEGDTLPVGVVIARLGGSAEAAGAGAPAQSAAPATPAEAPEAPTGGNGRIKASPIARRIARERGIELAEITGSGPGGRIVKADLEGALGGAGSSLTPGLAPGRPEAAKGATEVVELSKLQQTVARRMAESKATAPHFYLQAEIDMSRCVSARAQLKADARGDDTVPSFNDMVVRACALALHEFRRVNGSYRDGRFELYSRVNVGVAVAAPDALVVPTIFDADEKGLRQIAAESTTLAERVRAGQITPPELSGATFTVSNLGTHGISSFHPVINLPQAAILAVGAIAERPVVRDGAVTTAHLMSVTLACDHRILYGADGAEFVARVRSLLEEPLGLAV